MAILTALVQRFPLGRLMPRVKDELSYPLTSINPPNTNRFKFFELKNFEEMTIDDVERYLAGENHAFAFPLFYELYQCDKQYLIYDYILQHALEIQDIISDFNRSAMTDIAIFLRSEPDDLARELFRDSLLVISDTLVRASQRYIMRGPMEDGYAYAHEKYVDKLFADATRRLDPEARFENEPTLDERLQEIAFFAESFQESRIPIQ